jgi:RimJ/RimL family protein N-acetyltransferase
MPCQVTVRPYTSSDAEALYAAARESVDEVGPWMCWCHPDYSRADAEAWIEATVAGRESASLYDFAILADGQYAGGCGINHISWADRVANLGYWVRTSLTGKGIATMAALQVIEWAFENTTLNRVEIVVACDNVKSQRVAKKVGATRDAILRKRTMVKGRPVDAILYSVIRPD